MSITTVPGAAGVVEVVVDAPPVNALTATGWHALADAIVAGAGATFGLPEVDRGALGAATHLARLVPQHLVRAMVYTAKPATAAQLHAFGSVHSVVPPAELRAAALALAAEIAGKSP